MEISKIRGGSLFSMTEPSSPGELQFLLRANIHSARHVMFASGFAGIIKSVVGRVIPVTLKLSGFGDLSTDDTAEIMTRLLGIYHIALSHMAESEVQVMLDLLSSPRTLGNAEDWLCPNLRSLTLSAGSPYGAEAMLVRLAEARLQAFERQECSIARLEELRVVLDGRDSTYKAGPSDPWVEVDVNPNT